MKVSIVSSSPSSSSALVVAAAGLLMNGIINHVSAQQQQTVSISMPTNCTSQCTPFASKLMGCATSTSPSGDSQWVSIASQMTNCICPIVIADSSCSACLTSNYLTATSTKLLSNLQSSCGFNQTKTQVQSTLLQIWGSSANPADFANINNNKQANTTSTTTTTTGSKSAADGKLSGLFVSVVAMSLGASLLL